MNVYYFDIWDSDKGIIFANNEEEARKLFKNGYPDVPLDDEEDYDSGVCRIDYICEIPNRPYLIATE